jgi:NAD(P)-dependent dehydrogenase (short-subunit alcohol dehydrogenase family)
MRDFAGKTAFITGGAGGIGLAMARAFGRRGMKVSIADAEAETCAKTVESLRREGITAIGSACDVSDRDSLAEAAAKTLPSSARCMSSAIMRAYRARVRSRPSPRPIGIG